MHPRAQQALLLLTVTACLSASWNLGKLLGTNDPEGRWAKRVDYFDRERYAGLDEVLPPHGVVGYLDDGGCDNPVQGYYLTQYVLAPRVLVEDAARHLLLVNGRPDRPPALPADLVLVRDLGNGVRVYRRGAP